VTVRWDEQQMRNNHRSYSLQSNNNIICHFTVFPVRGDPNKWPTQECNSGTCSYSLHVHTWRLKYNVLKQNCFKYLTYTLITNTFHVKVLYFMLTSVVAHKHLHVLSVVPVGCHGGSPSVHLLGYSLYNQPVARIWSTYSRCFF